MFTKRNLGQLIFAAAIILSILACGGGTVVPTSTPPPPPTNTPPPPPPPPTPPPPTPTTAVVAPPTPTEAGGIVPGALNVIAVNGYKDTFDNWEVIGLVSNDTGRIVNDIQVEVEIFDANNVSIYRENTDTELYTVAPGEVTPFSLWVSEELPAADHYVATIVGSNVADVERGPAEAVKVTRVIDQYGDLYLTGEITNTGDKPIHLSGLAAATFDSSGTLLAVASYSAILSYLDPGESGPFRISLVGAEGSAEQATEHKIYIDAQVTDAAPTFDIGGLDQFGQYVDTSDYLHLVVEVANNTNETLVINLVAIAYDAEGKVLDASSISMPYYPAPGEKVACDFDSWGPLNWVPGTLDKVASIKVLVDRYWTWDTTTEYVAMTTSDDAPTFDTYQATFTGKVVNNTGAKITSATVVVSLYDKASGKLVATDYDYIFDEIADGATGDYEVRLQIPKDFDENTVNIVITVKGQR